MLPRSHGHDNLEADVDSLDSDDDEEDRLTRDEFNLHKMLVLVTAPGKVGRRLPSDSK